MGSETKNESDLVYSQGSNVICDSLEQGKSCEELETICLPSWENFHLVCRFCHSGLSLDVIKLYYCSLNDTVMNTKAEMLMLGKENGFPDSVINDKTLRGGRKIGERVGEVEV